MRIPGLKTAKMITKWVRGRLFGGAFILGYHRVHSASGDAYEICVSPENFEAQMQVLRKFAVPLSLSEMVQHVQRGTLPRKSVAVTFDDGYADNLYNAKPVLEQYQIPASIFIATGYTGKEFWWDELQRLVTTSRSSLERLKPLVHEGKISEAAAAGERTRAGSSGTVDRRKIADAMYADLLPLPDYDRASVMDRVRAWAAVQPQDSFAHRALTDDEIVRLAQGGCVSIGAHARSHSILPSLSVPDQLEEVLQSKQYLESLLGRPVDGFAYPHGQFTDETQSVVEEAGFAFACASYPDLFWQSSQQYALPRFWPQDWDGDRFARTLKLWLGD